MKKIYCYVDESGQDTEGKIFLVSVIISGPEREELREFLLTVERETGKKTLKWQKTNFHIRLHYLKKVFSASEWRGKIYFSRYNDSRAYVDLTILTTAKAILNKVKDGYRATIIIDGLKRSEIKQYASGLRKLKIRVRKVRGARDESEPLIRLADAVAGFVRDYFEKQDYAVKLYQQASKKRIIKEI